MFAFWRLVIFLVSTVISTVILVILIRGASINITGGSSLPSLDLKSIPPADTIIPAIIEQGNADFNINPNTPTSTSTSTPTLTTPTSTPTLILKPISKSTTLKPTTRKTTSKLTNTTPSSNIVPTEIMEIVPLPFFSSEISSENLNENLNENSNENSTETCLSFARNCRDIQCAFKNFKVSCYDTSGPICACLISGSTSIREKINSFTLIISLLISLWVGLQ